MSKYILRLDDACEKWDKEKWVHMEMLLDQYGIKPLVGIIPHCEDQEMEKYGVDHEFWNRVNNWRDKGWTLAMHGYNHVYSTNCGGINPVNNRSEFAGLSVEEQKTKIKAGVGIFRVHGMDPQIFFAPSHTFDKNTLEALRQESNIRIISDTIAWDTYRQGEFIFVPQQSGKVRKLPFGTVTFCYHPNTMDEGDFKELDGFIQENRAWFVNFSTKRTDRKYGMLDLILRKGYFLRRR